MTKVMAGACAIYDSIRARSHLSNVPMRFLFSLALAASALLSFSAIAEDVIAIDSTPAQIRAAQAELRQAIERKSGNYAHFSDIERKAIFAKQDEVTALIDGKNAIDELNPDGKIALANALEGVKALVARAEDSRLICERIKPIGSNRPQNKCISVGERRRLREQVQRDGVKVNN